MSQGGNICLFFTFRPPFGKQAKIRQSKMSGSTSNKIRRGAFGKLEGGPIAVVIAEDSTEVLSTLVHLVALGFAKLILIAPPGMFDLSERPELADWVLHIEHATRQPEIVTEVVNAVIEQAPGTWIHYCFNGEYLFFPFCETRSIAAAAAFVEEERRHSILTFVVDLYAGNLSAFPDAVSLETAHLDTSCYYAETRRNAADDIMERQLNFYGGLKWRFEEHIAAQKRRIDRIGLFQARPGLALRPDHTLNDEELNTYACPWHHSMTAAICSFRVAKALRTNPGSRHDVGSFLWHRSEPFAWTSQQLLDLGLIEPGQWF